MIFPLPEIDLTRPLYLYGAGMMGVSYKRQIEQKGMLSLLEGFIVDRPVMASYLGVPVIKRADLTAQQLRAGQFLIASDRLRDVFEDHLIRQGCPQENIIYPLRLAWKGRSVMAGIKQNSKGCIYPMVSSHEDLSLIGRQVNKKKSELARRGIKLHMTVVVDAAINFSVSDYPEIEWIVANSRDDYPSELLEKSDLIVILNASDLAEMDAVYHDKVFFYGLTLFRGLRGELKRRLAKAYIEKHQALREAAKNKERLRVVFLALYKSVWKVDQILKRMLVDACFEPLILVCPYMTYGEERMWQDMNEVYEFFAAKGYPVLSSYDVQARRWINLSELNPDIVFFTYSHKVTRREYHEEAYFNYLSCYVPYFTDIASGYDVYDAYDKFFHNVVWKIFHADENTVSRASQYSLNKGANIVLSGSPFLEGFFVEGSTCSNPWGTRALGKKMIIYAPHQAITNENNLHLSTFLHVAELMRALAIKYKDAVIWSFRPHTILKSRLYEHADWGKERTDEYYAFWRDFESSSLDDGDYIELFKASDAIIHDCGSFIFEYLLVEKPCAYLFLNGPHQLEPINDHGKRLLSYYRVIDALGDVERFVLDVVNDRAPLKPGHRAFVADVLGSLQAGGTPSERVIQNLKASIWGVDNGE